MFMFCLIEFFASGIPSEPADKGRNDNDTGYGSHYAEIPVPGNDSGTQPECKQDGGRGKGSYQYPVIR